MDFLTKRTQFQCVVSPPVIFTISASGKVTHKNSTVLTTSAKLSGKGFCPILKAPCQFQQTPWQLFDLTRKADGKNLLTDKTFCNCPIGPVVKVRAALAFGYQDGKFSAQTAPSVASLPPLQDKKENISTQTDSLKTNNLQTPSSKLQPKNKQENEVDVAKNTVQEKNVESTEKVAYSLKCLKCDKKNCKYRLDKFKDFSDEVKTSSAKLAGNYDKYLKTTDESKLNAADKSYKRSLEMKDSFVLKDGWNYGAHHIIPANQAFAKFPELVKVATACGYDINCAENCIMLPAKEEGHGNFDADSKSDSAFAIMALTNMQCHLGPHEYKISEILAAQVHRHLGRRVKIKSYAELLREKLSKINLSKDGEVCPKEIIASLNKISAEVREKLSKFKENPKSSYPYYVSRRAYLYAFNDSTLKKFISAGRGGAKLIFKRLKPKK